MLAAIRWALWPERRCLGAVCNLILGVAHPHMPADLHLNLVHCALAPVSCSGNTSAGSLYLPLSGSMP